MKTLINGLEILNIKYTENQLRQINEFYEMLIEKNKVMNLTRITDRNDFFVKHVLDSLLISCIIELMDQTVIDIGTGAGFPGIPLKIFFPDINLVLLDSVNKKLVFIEEIINDLGLYQINTVHGRAEDIANKTEYREQFDLAVSRAVADLSVLSELCIPFVKPGGSFIAYKSSECDEEINKADKAIRVLSGSPVEVSEIIIPGTDINRKLIRIGKISKTSKLYPRKPGIPNRDPI